jgi:hypothetical protein
MNVCCGILPVLEMMGKGPPYYSYELVFVSKYKFTERFVAIHPARF